MATFYLDIEGGSDAADGTTFANRWKTFTNGPTAARIAPGDTIRMMAARRSNIAGCAWTRGSNTVTLPSSLTALITDCESVWTASANVTASVNAGNGWKTGSYSAAFVIASGFTTGKIAYFDLGSNQDYSAYQQISLYFNASSTQAANVFEIKLCSDTTGDTPVNTLPINIPATSGYPVRKVTLNYGANLGSAIRSIAIYATSDPGTPVVYLDHIIACKAKSASDCITLNHVIKKSGTNHWYMIRSIFGTTLTLETYTPNGFTVSNCYGFSGTTETADAVLLECVSIPSQGVSQSLNEPGTGSARITFAGGYNRTDMSSIDHADDFTFIGFNGENYSAIFGSGADFSYITFSKAIFFSGASYFIASGSSPSNDLIFDNCHTTLSGGANIYSAQFINCTICSNAAAAITMPYWLYESTLSFFSVGNSYSPTFYGGFNNDILIDGVLSPTAAVYLPSARVHFKSLVIANADFGIAVTNGFGNDIVIESGSITATTGIVIGSNYGLNVQANNFDLVCTTEISYDIAALRGWETRVAITNFEADGVHKITQYCGVINSETSVRHTASGIAWKMQPTSTAAGVTSPLKLLVASLYCEATSSTVTISVWFRRTNTEVSGRLCVYANSLGGITTDQTDDMTVAADTWEELSVSFVPTKSGVLEVWALAWGGTTRAVYVDDLTVTVTP